jgi:hypothetical protein
MRMSLAQFTDRIQRLAPEPRRGFFALRLRSLLADFIFCDVIGLSSFPPLPPFSLLRGMAPTNRGHECLIFIIYMID